MHFCEYGVLTFVTFLSFAGEEFNIRFRKFMLITTFLVTFAVLDELHQKLIPGRTCSIKDMTSDVTGILAAIIFTLLIFRSIGINLRKSD
jgi:VanZ family protein